jgi:hypothetical protein
MAAAANGIKRIITILVDAGSAGPAGPGVITYLTMTGEFLRLRTL